MMYEEEVKHYDHSNELCHLFFEWIKNNTEAEVKMQYVLSFLNYVGASDQGEAKIQIKVDKFIYAWISFRHALYETDKGVSLALWKYNGEHYFKNDPWCEDYTEKDFPEMWQRCCKFFGFSTEEKYEQLSLFDFI